MVLNTPRASGGQRVLVINPFNSPIPIALVDPDKNTYVDITDGSVSVIEHAHKEIHEGNLFRYSYIITVNTGINVDLLLVTPNQDYEWHFEGVINTSAGATIMFYEDVITSNNGVGETVRNANRQSPNSNTMNVFVGPTVTNLGMLLDVSYLGAGNTQGGMIRSEYEWVLKSNTKYLLRVVSNGNNNRITVRINWYEES